MRSGEEFHCCIAELSIPSALHCTAHAVRAVRAVQGIFQSLWTGVGFGVAGVLGGAQPAAAAVLALAVFEPDHINREHVSPPADNMHASTAICFCAGGVLYGSHGPDFLFRLSGEQHQPCVCAGLVVSGGTASPLE